MDVIGIKGESVRTSYSPDYSLPLSLYSDYAELTPHVVIVMITRCTPCFAGSPEMKKHAHIMGPLSQAPS